MKKLLPVSLCLSAIAVALSCVNHLPPNLIPFSNAQNHLKLEQLTGEFNPNLMAGVFHNQKIVVPADAPSDQPDTTTLGYKTPANNKRIEVDLTNQRVYAYEGDNLIYNFLVSTGKWGRTPTGEFRIWIKLRYALMTGGSTALGTYYYLPNIPYTMYYYNNEVSMGQGYSLHGTYWHDNFGHPMSHGCINMRTEDVEKLYYWATPYLNEETWGIRSSTDNPGTLVKVYGIAPT